MKQIGEWFLGGHATQNVYGVVLTDLYSIQFGIARKHKDYDPLTMNSEYEILWAEKQTLDTNPLRADTIPNLFSYLYAFFDHQINFLQK